MVVKTDICFFSDNKIYPGHGRRFVRKDGKLLMFLDSKCESLYHQKIKNQKLTWTQAWRTLHKKGKKDLIGKKKTKKAARSFRAIQGMSMEEIQKRRQQKPEFRKAARDAALREVKERAKKDKDAAKKADKKDKKKIQFKPVAFQKVPKQRRLGAR